MRLLIFLPRRLNDIFFTYLNVWDSEDISAKFDVSSSSVYERTVYQ